MRRRPVDSVAVAAGKKKNDEEDRAPVRFDFNEYSLKTIENFNFAKSKQSGR